MTEDEKVECRNVTQVILEALKETGIEENTKENRDKVLEIIKSKVRNDVGVELNAYCCEENNPPTITRMRVDLHYHTPRSIVQVSHTLTSDMWLSE